MAYAVVASLSAVPGFSGHVKIVGEKTHRHVLRRDDPVFVLKDAGVGGLVQVTQEGGSGFVVSVSRVPLDLQCVAVVKTVRLEDEDFVADVLIQKGRLITIGENCPGFSCIQQEGQTVNVFLVDGKIVCVWLRPVGWIL